jgi:hypothetical protein
MDKPWWEDPLCWLCDYGIFVMVFFLILIFGAYRFLYKAVPATPLAVPTPVATLMTVTLTNTASPVETSAVPALTSTPAPERTEFILVFVPVNWASGQPAFQQAAQDQANIFITKSGIENYFTVTVVALENGIADVSLASDTLVYDVLEFALQVQPGERYVGLTDGDLNPGGDSNVVGWTSGGSAMVAEYQNVYVVTHELGHTFGLCDEYNYAVWSRQNEEYDGGCPNPYPQDCTREESNQPTCNGTPALDGNNSIMGPAGLTGEYSFNDASYSHLQEVFGTLSSGGNQ